MKRGNESEETKDLRYIGDEFRITVRITSSFQNPRNGTYSRSWLLQVGMEVTVNAPDFPHIQAHTYVLVQHLEMLIESRLGMESLLLLADDLINLSLPGRSRM